MFWSRVAPVVSAAFAAAERDGPMLSNPQGIANLVVFLCSAANVNITGETNRVTGGR